MKRETIYGLVLGLMITLVVGARAEEGVMEKAGDQASSAAESMDKAAHKAKRKVKHHARKAKTDVQNATDDNPVRKGARRAKDAGNDALDKVEDTVHGH